MTTNGRLATATTNGITETYSFDPAGNLTSIGPGTSLTYQENRLSTMTQGGQTTYFFFDSAKRWRTVQAPTNSQTDPNRTTYSYTGTGRLATWTKYTGGSASTTATYTYDSQGQRTRSVVAVSGGLSTTTDFVYEGLLLQSLSATQVGTGATSWRITYLYDERGKPYAGIYRSPASSTGPVLFALVTTDRGDVVGLLDAEGSPFAAYRYDAWGNPQGSGNVATGIWSQSTGLISSQLASDIARRQVLRYASYCYDPESGLYYLSARSYDPKTRQFLSKDLSRSDGEQSAYQYCGGNPVRYVDPTGYYWAPANTAQNRLWVSLNLWRNYAKRYAAEQEKAKAYVANKAAAQKRTQAAMVSEQTKNDIDKAAWLGSSSFQGTDKLPYTDWRQVGYYAVKTTQVVCSAAGAVMVAVPGGQVGSLALFVASVALGEGASRIRGERLDPQEIRESAYTQAVSMALPTGNLPSMVVGALGAYFQVNGYQK